MGIENCIILYNSTIDIKSTIGEFLEDLKNNNINFILINNEYNNINEIISKYNNRKNMIISLDTKEIEDNIIKVFNKESQIACYYHIDYNPYIKKFVDSKNVIEKMELESLIKNNSFKINESLYNDKIIIGKDFFEFIPEENSLKNILNSLIKYKKFKKCFSEDYKRDIIYISEEECGNQFFYFGIITYTKDYNSISIFENENKVNILLIKKLNNKEIFKLFKSLLINKKIPEEVLTKCVIISSEQLRLISNDNNKIYIDNKKSNEYACLELNFEFNNKIKIIKKR